MNIAELAIKSLDKFGEYESLHFEGKWYTNAELINRSQQVSQGLTDLGVKHGDRVTTVLGNCIEVLGFSCLTNAAAGVTGEVLDHAEVLQVGTAAAAALSELLRDMLAE